MKNCYLALSLVALAFIGAPLQAFETILPDFSGGQSEFSIYRTRITAAMLQGPNFAEHYTLITIGCGTECLFGYVANNKTGELYYFPFGGEEHSRMQLEFSLTTDKVLVSFQYNPISETSEGWRPLYEVGESPCVAKSLQFRDGKFVEERAREVNRFGRACPVASELFAINDNGLSRFEEECFTKYTRMDLCRKVKEMTEAASKELPQKIDSELTIISLRSEGASLQMIARWELNDNELDQRLTANNLTLAQIREVLSQSARNHVCSHEAVSAFIRLGGQINYRYITKEHSGIADIQIDSCS